MFPPKAIVAFPNEFVVVDLETTGFNSENDSIIEIVAVRYVNHQIVGQFVELVRPSRAISAMVSRITGITNQMVANARSDREVLADFMHFLGNSPVVGYNINFDIKFIFASLMRNYNYAFSNLVIDVLPIVRKQLALPKSRLEDASNYYRLNYSGAHRALKDVQLTHDVYYLLKCDIYNQYGSFDSWLAYHGFLK